MGQRMPPPEAERIIRLVAAHVRTAVYLGARLLSAELPETGERFTGAMPPIVRAPSFTIRKRALRMMTLAYYKGALRTETGLQDEQRIGGTLQLYRTARQMEAVQRDVSVLQECVVPQELLNREGLACVKRALAHTGGALFGSLCLPKDKTGDCHLLTNRLADVARGLGVEFRFGATVQQLLAESGRITGLRGDGLVLTADRYVLALDSNSCA